MLKIAESTQENNYGLKEVIIMNHAPRYDTKKADPLEFMSGGAAVML